MSEMKRQCSILCGLIALLSLAACTAREPGAVIVVETVEVEGEPRCYVECVDSLQISLDGAVPQEFVLTLTLGAGPVGRVRCVNGHATECWAYGRSGCSPYLSCFGTAGHQTVGWLGEPSNFDVTVTWDGNEIVEHIEPNYRAVVDCLGQTCYSAKVTITLPESP